jgi:hypothetical protein
MNGPLEECGRKAQDTTAGQVADTTWQRAEDLIWTPIAGAVDFAVAGPVRDALWRAKAQGEK